MSIAVDHLVNNAGVAHSFFFSDTKDLQSLTSTFVRFVSTLLMDKASISKLNVLTMSAAFKRELGDLLAGITCFSHLLTI